MNYNTSSEFDRELKKFTKNWPSLRTDFNPVRKTLPLLYELQENEVEADLKLRRDNFFNNKKAAILKTVENKVEVVKMRLDCASLGNKNLLRFVFVYVKINQTITFIELYSKNDKQREDQSRIKKYL